MIAIQNPSVFTKGALQIVDAYYDIRSGRTGQPASFSVSGYGGALPVTIQSMPEENIAAVYGSGDGSLTTANYQTEKTTGTVSGLNGASSSIFMTRNGTYVFAASQGSHVFTIVNQSNGSSYPLSLPGVYRVSVNPGGSMALAFVENSNYAYYPRQLTAAQSLSVLRRTSPPGPRPRWIVSRRMLRAGACSRRKAPTSLIRPAITTALRSCSTGRQRLCSPAMAARPTC